MIRKANLLPCPLKELMLSQPFIQHAGRSILSCGAVRLLKDLMNRYKMYLIRVSFIFASQKVFLPAVNLLSVMYE